MNILQKEIRDWLEASGLTQADLSRDSSVPTSTISVLLSGKRKNVTWITADRLRESMRRLMPAHEAQDE